MKNGARRDSPRSFRFRFLSRQLFPDEEVGGRRGFLPKDRVRPLERDGARGLVRPLVTANIPPVCARGCSTRTATVPRPRRGRNSGCQRTAGPYRRSRWSSALNGAMRARGRSWTCWRWMLTSFAGVRYASGTRGCVSRVFRVGPRKTRRE